MLDVINSFAKGNQLLIMSASSSPKPFRAESASRPQSNRLFDVFNQFADRSQAPFRKRPRGVAEAKESLVKLVPSLLDTSTTSSASFRNKRLRISKSNVVVKNEIMNKDKGIVAEESPETTDTTTPPQPKEDSTAPQSSTSPSQEAPETVAQTPVKNSSTAVAESKNPDVERYQKEIQQNEKDLEVIEKHKRQLQKEVVELWGAYRYGLTKIGTLGDLAHAPDAIMPGNF